MQQPPRRAQERQHEQRAQPDPDPRRVGRPAELAGVAARHRPGHPEARPALEHAAADRSSTTHLGDLLALGRRRENETCQRPPLAQVGARVAAGMRGARRAHRLGGAAAARTTLSALRIRPGRRTVEHPRLAQGAGRAHGAVPRAPGRRAGGPAASGRAARRRRGGARPRRARRRRHRAQTEVVQHERDDVAQRPLLARVGESGPVPHHSSEPKESTACSEPCEPPPTWCARPQSRNS